MHFSSRTQSVASWLALESIHRQLVVLELNAKNLLHFAMHTPLHANGISQSFVRYIRFPNELRESENKTMRKNEGEWMRKRENSDNTGRRREQQTKQNGCRTFCSRTTTTTWHVWHKFTIEIVIREHNVCVCTHCINVRFNVFKTSTKFKRLSGHICRRIYTLIAFIVDFTFRINLHASTWKTKVKKCWFVVITLAMALDQTLPLSTERMP